jgi:hypothetical protein
MFCPCDESTVQNDLEVLAGGLKAPVSLIAAHIEQNTIDEQNKPRITWASGEHQRPRKVRLNVVGCDGRTCNVAHKYHHGRSGLRAERRPRDYHGAMESVGGLNEGSKSKVGFPLAPATARCKARNDEREGTCGQKDEKSRT